jgi:hypothetical protein
MMPSASTPRVVLDPEIEQFDSSDDDRDSSTAADVESVYDDVDPDADVSYTTLEHTDCRVPYKGVRACGRDAKSCQRGRNGLEDHAKFRAEVKNGTRLATDLVAPGNYKALPPTRINGVNDGLIGSRLSDAEAQKVRLADLQKKREAILTAQSSSPVLRMSYKTPEHGAVADEAIEVGSGSLGTDEHSSRVSFLGRQVQRLEREAFETASAASTSAAAATYAAAAASEDATLADTSRVPNDEMQAQVAYLERQVNRLEM